jgi:hypothetical protein
MTSLLLGLDILACTPTGGSTSVIYSNYLTSLDGVITREGVTLDATISPRGYGTIRVDAARPLTVRLVEVRPPQVQNSTLTFRGHLRAKNLQGRAYLEIAGTIPGKGEFSSRGLQSAISGSTEWTSQRTTFEITSGNQVEIVHLNAVIEGTGIVWIGPILLAQSVEKRD